MKDNPIIALCLSRTNTVNLNPKNALSALPKQRLAFFINFDISAVLQIV